MNLKGRGLWSIIIRKTEGTVLGSCSFTTERSSLSKTIVRLARARHFSEHLIDAL
jgi:hypothetical protein